jgi:glycosyltransferase involved in cell wall biosynthesis
VIILAQLLTMKILQIIPTYKPAFGYGGTITSISLLCENLVNYGGCQVTVAATNANVKKDLPVHSRTPVLVEGVHVYYFRRWTPDHSQLSPPLLWWLWRNVKNYDAVHIHSWWNLTVIFSTVVCLLRGVKPVHAPRGMLSPFSIKGRFKPVFQRFIGNKLLKNVFLHATSEQERTECLELIPNWQSENIPNFLTIPTIKTVKTTPNSDSFRLLFLSRIHEKKGLELLFEALSKVQFQWTLSIAGDGEEAYIQQLKKLSEDLKIDSKINWLGWVNANERLSIFQAADLMVLPSHNENFANVVIESLAVGTAVLVSQYVGLVDYVVEKNMGWVCDTTVESLFEKLNEAHIQTGKRIEIASRSGEQIRKDFDPSVLVRRYLKMYQKVKNGQLATHHAPYSDVQRVS